MNEPAIPTAIVCSSDIGSLPGSASRASAPVKQTADRQREQVDQHQRVTGFARRVRAEVRRAEAVRRAGGLLVARVARRQVAQVAVGDAGGTGGPR